MRAVASFSFLLLILAASFDFLSWSQVVESKRIEVESKRKAHRIRAFSSGWNFPPVQQGITNQFEGALVDDRWCRGGRREGLRVISIPADGGEILIENFKLLETDDMLDRFEALIIQAKLNTTLVLSSKQNIGRIPTAERKASPELGEKRREKAGFLLRGLGARSNPEDYRHASFVFICVRRPDGFIPLAEKFSTTRGVALSMNLDEDVSVYDDHVAETVIDNRWLLKLKSELAKGEQLVVEPGKRFISERGYANLRTKVQPDQTTRIKWDVPEVCENTVTPGTKDVPFARENLDEGGQVSFSAKLAWRYLHDTEPVALEFVLRVNGRNMGKRVILNELAEAERWVLWEELLAADVGPIEELEIEIRRIGEGGPVHTVHLAEVQLSAGELYSF